MSAAYLIDGYNLIHGIGLLPPRVGPGGLEKARRALLGLLKGSFGDGASAVTVVVDASRAPAGAEVAEIYHPPGPPPTCAGGQRTRDKFSESSPRRAGAPRPLPSFPDPPPQKTAPRPRHAQFRGWGVSLHSPAKRRQKAHPKPAAPEKQERL